MQFLWLLYAILTCPPVPQTSLPQGPAFTALPQPLTPVSATELSAFHPWPLPSFLSPLFPLSPLPLSLPNIPTSWPSMCSSSGCSLSYLHKPAPQPYLRAVLTFIHCYSS